MFWLHSINMVLMRGGAEEDAKNQLKELSGGLFYQIVKPKPY